MIIGLTAAVIHVLHANMVREQEWKLRWNQAQNQGRDHHITGPLAASD